MVERPPDSDSGQIQLRKLSMAGCVPVIRMESLPDCRSVVRKLGRRKVFFDVALGKMSPPAIYSIESDSHDDAGPQSPEHGIEEPRAEHAVQAHQWNAGRSEEHTSELQSLRHLVCRLLLEKKKKKITIYHETKAMEYRTGSLTVCSVA